MIGRLLSLLARCLLETACILLAVALVFAVASFRVGRRLVRDAPDPFERLSENAARLNAFFPARVAPVGNGQAEGVESYPDEEGDLA